MRPSSRFSKWKRLATEYSLARHNDATISSPARFIRELTVTRERGYAFDNEEFDIGMRCIAVPVSDASVETVAAIAVTGTTLEIYDDTFDSLKCLKAAADCIRKSFGALAGTRAGAGLSLTYSRGQTPRTASAG